VKLPPLVLDDLKRSGLTAEDAKRLQIEYRAAHIVEPTKGCLGGQVRAYRLPYFDLRGKPTAFARYKLLDPYTPKGAKRPAKYLQDSGTAPHFYLPPYLDWERVAKDPATPLYITEGRCTVQDRRAMYRARRSLEFPREGGRAGRPHRRLRPDRLERPHRQCHLRLRRGLQERHPRRYAGAAQRVHQAGCQPL
jgi:hypothetical protein